MSDRIALTHVTHYTYDRPTWLGPQTVRLKPNANCKTPVLRYQLAVLPQPSHINWHLDPFGNHQARLVVPGLIQEFKLSVDLEVLWTPHNPFDFFLDPEVLRYPWTYHPALGHPLAPYLSQEPAGPALTQYVESLDLSACSTVDFLVRTNQRIFQDISYTVRHEPGVQTPETTLSTRSGSCRDSAWLLVQVFRRCGIAARFTSGYLIQLAQQPAHVGSEHFAPTQLPVKHDQGELHAWCEVYLPGAGWVGLDSTSGLLTGEGHIPLASSSHPDSAAPISGEIGPCVSTMSYSHTVRHLGSVDPAQLLV